MATIIVYATTDEHCPPAARFTARTFVDGKPMPVTFYGPNEPDVRAMASNWWDAQVKAEKQRADGAEKRKAALAEARTRAQEAR